MLQAITHGESGLTEHTHSLPLCLHWMATIIPCITPCIGWQRLSPALDGNDYTEDHSCTTVQQAQLDVHPNSSSSTQELSETLNESSDVPLRGAAEHSSQAQILASSTSSLTMQCPVCERVLCETKDLAFFHRVNKQDGVEVHLMLKPENDVPETFKPAELKPKASESFNCACGARLGDTRPVAVKKKPMTAFKSSSVILCGQHFPGKKSKWPTVYNTPPFDCIEVRHRDTYFGMDD